MTLLVHYTTLVRLLFKFISSESCETNQAGAEKENGCWFWYGVLVEAGFV